VARTFLIERRLRALSTRLDRLRADLAVVDEQVLHFQDDADDARIRALVSETPLASAEQREADRSSNVMIHHRAELVASIAELEAEQDSLLDKLADRLRSST
jgi:hypothetical protein